jgi:hypothetical protein
VFKHLVSYDVVSIDWDYPLEKNGLWGEPIKKISVSFRGLHNKDTFIMIFAKYQQELMEAVEKALEKQGKVVYKGIPSYNGKYDHYDSRNTLFIFELNE